ncbi:MAG: helix-turn-helix transcriptional regulator [Lachnospiraceae bacterium]|nr:helix-turn-helix transcriptional regulator [Lachnospiraceae bacterium]
MKQKTTPDAIGERIKILREKNHNTQNDLAEILSCKQNNISQMEKGKSLTIDNLIAIANYYNVSLDYLCKGEGGFDLLDTLNKFVQFKYERINVLDEVDKSPLLPHIYINRYLYSCMKQISLATQNLDMPKSVKEDWIKLAINEFNEKKDIDDYKDFVTFIVLNYSTLDNNPDLIHLIEKQIIG